MKVSVLQEARYGYQPKLPVVLRNPIDTIKPVNGAPTRSVADQEKIKALFPKTYGLSKVSVEKGENPDCGEKRNVGVILSGGQAPGGHNVISGLFDALKKRIRKAVCSDFLAGRAALRMTNTSKSPKIS